jgi:uncharacterized protein
MEEKDVIRLVEDFARKSTEGADSGHDWWHLDRVRNISLYLQKKEKKGNRYIIELAALLHDVDDSKFRKPGNSKAGTIINDFLTDVGVEGKIIEEVIRINKYISFSASESPDNKSFEFMIVQDADRLDAIGAIGIARTFNYGGFRNNPIFIPETESGDKSPTTIGHFYDKLLLLKELMNTGTAKKVAEDRHSFMLKFLKQFYKEVLIKQKSRR